MAKRGHGSPPRTGAPKRPRRFRKILIGALLAVGVILVWCAGILGEAQYVVATHWPLVEAEVIRSQAPPEDEGYRPEVEFRYRVEGVEYDVKTNPATRTTNYATAKGIADRFAPGSRHFIRYNPVHPAEVSANAGFTLDFFWYPIALGIGGAVVLFGTWWFGIRTPPEGNPARRAVVYVGVFVAGMGILWVVIGVFTAWHEHAVQTDWPIVDAQTGNGRVRRYLRQNQRGRDIPHYEVTVEFRYAVNGRDYVSPAWVDFNTSEAAQQALARYAPLNRHEIRYNPANPNEIRFSTETSYLGAAIELSLGLLLAVVGSLVVYFSNRPKAGPVRRKTPHFSGGAV